MKWWFRNNTRGEITCERKRERVYKHICTSSKKRILKNIQSMKQTEADKTTPSSHADAYPNVGITHIKPLC